ncbi:transposase family protein [Streptomyces mirabilis]
MLSGASSLLVIGEWIADPPPCMLEHLGIRPDPLLPRRHLPTESTVRRLLARIDGDALDRAVGCWLADRRPVDTAPAALRGMAADGKRLRGAAKAEGRKSRRPAPAARPGRAGAGQGQDRRRLNRGRQSASSGSASCSGNRACSAYRAAGADPCTTARARSRRGCARRPRKGPCWCP